VSGERPPPQEIVIMGFDSIHDVLAAEARLIREEIPCELIPTPREISADCGMSVACRARDLDRLRALNASGQLRWRLLVRP
jgi:hypothetical protein